MWLRRAGGWLGLALVAALLAACGTTAATPAPVYLRVAGSSSLQPALVELAAAYRERFPHVTIDIQTGDTGSGLQALQAGAADLAAASWKDTTAAGDETLTWHGIGRDAVVLVVHPANTLTDLSLVRARDVFAGWYTSWSEVGGKGAEIQPVSREDGSGTRAAFEAGVMGLRDVTQTALVMPSSAAVVQWVSTHPNAVGYVSMAYITAALRALRLEGQEPTAKNVEAGVYPLTRTLYLVTRAPTERPAQDFVNFCLSPAGQAILARHYARK
jgi:phosphate transport system substrate-binding protein